MILNLSICCESFGSVLNLFCVIFFKRARIVNVIAAINGPENELSSNLAAAVLRCLGSI